MKKIVVPVKSQLRSASTKSQPQSVAVVSGSSQQHVPSSVCPPLKMTQSGDVTDLPQDDAGCPTPADSDIIVGAAAVPQDFDYMQAMIEEMARDMAIQENSMSVWGIPGNMFEEEDCLGFF